MSKFKKILYLLMLFGYIVGVIGGIGYTLYSSAWLIALCITWLGVMAFPTFMYIFHELTD